MKDTNPYPLLLKQLQALLAGESNMVTNLSQFASFVYHHLETLNWAGFYLNHRDQHLQLGPYQGSVACTKIPFGKGVCGTAGSAMRSLVVDDVNQYEGHIACDSRSQSELVCPLIVNQQLVGVFDLDSPITARFSETDKIGIESLVQVLNDNTNWGNLVEQVA